MGRGLIFLRLPECDEGRKSSLLIGLEGRPGTSSRPRQSNKSGQLTKSVTTRRPRNIDLVPIDYGFRPRLRGRLTLRGLTLRRNPWTFGDRVSHSVDRYSCQHSRFRYLQQRSRATFAGLRNAPLPRVLPNCLNNTHPQLRHVA